MTEDDLRFVQAGDPTEPPEHDARPRVSSRHALSAPFYALTVSWPLITPGLLVVVAETSSRWLLKQRSHLAAILIPGLTVVSAAAFAAILSGALSVVRTRRFTMAAITRGVRQAHWVALSAFIFVLPAFVLSTALGGPPQLEARAWLIGVTALVSGLLGTRLFSALPAAIEKRQTFAAALLAPAISSGLERGNLLTIWLLATAFFCIWFEGSYSHLPAVTAAYSVFGPIVIWPFISIVWADLFAQATAPGH